MAAIFSSSVWALFMSAAPFETALTVAALIVCSLRDWFFALTGILPETYRAALPAPGFIGGRRRATTVVDRGMIVVSSSYSAGGGSAQCRWVRGHTAQDLPSFPSSV